MNKVGITTTVPLEPFLASGTTPVDLNNIFISSPDPAGLVEEAQVHGYPRNICTWIKGIFSVACDFDGVVGVVRGDCSNTESLLETLDLKGIPTHPFSYPPDRNRDRLVEEIGSLCDFLGCSIEDAKDQAGRVRHLRQMAWKVDELLSLGRVSASDAHLLMVSCSDLMSDPSLWERRARDVIESSSRLDAPLECPKIGYIGVPPIITDIFDRIEGSGGNIAFMETQRQFTMPFPNEDWIGSYLSYTYPFSITGRVKDIKDAIEERRLSGIVHYVQSFCHRQIDDIIFRSELRVPVLTLEGNIPGPMDERTAIRLEAFLDVLEMSFSSVYHNDDKNEKKEKYPR